MFLIKTATDKEEITRQTHTHLPELFSWMEGYWECCHRERKTNSFPPRKWDSLAMHHNQQGRWAGGVGLGGDGTPQEMGRSRISCPELEAGAHPCSPPPSQSTVPGTSPVLSQHVLSGLKVRHHFAAELYLMQPLEKKEKSKVHQFFTLLFFWFMRWFFILLKSDSIF